MCWRCFRSKRRSFLKISRRLHARFRHCAMSVWVTSSWDNRRPPCRAERRSGSNWRPSFPSGRPAEPFTSWTNRPPVCTQRMYTSSSRCFRRWWIPAIRWWSSSIIWMSSKQQTISSTLDPREEIEAVRLLRPEHRSRWHSAKAPTPENI